MTTSADFANDADFSFALDEMKSVGVSESRVQAAWAIEIKDLCGDKAASLQASDVGPGQTLSGLMGLLSLTQ